MGGMGDYQHRTGKCDANKVNEHHNKQILVFKKQIKLNYHLVLTSYVPCVGERKRLEYDKGKTPTPNIKLKSDICKRTTQKTQIKCPVYMYVKKYKDGNYQCVLVIQLVTLRNGYCTYLYMTIDTV